MSYRNWWSICAVVLIGTVVACSSGSGPDSSAAASVSGTVLDANNASMADVSVTFEQYDDAVLGMHHDMMHGQNWEQAQHMMTDAHGHFHFEYMHDGHHEYRVRAEGSGPGGMCYLDGGVEDGVVLHVSTP